MGQDQLEEFYIPFWPDVGLRPPQCALGPGPGQDPNPGLWAGVGTGPETCIMGPGSGPDPNPGLEARGQGLSIQILYAYFFIRTMHILYA